MRETEVPVAFQPSGKTVYVLQGTRLMEAAAGAGIVVDQPCGGEGVCGKCRVALAKGAQEPVAAEIEAFAAEELDAGWRLACQAVVDEPATVEIPDTSLLQTEGKILARAHESSFPVGDPPIRKKYVELARPTRGDDAPGIVRLQAATGPFHADLDLLGMLPGRLREIGFCGTAVLVDDGLIDLEPGNTENTSYAVAVDVGTTTLVAVLFDLNTAGELAVVSRMNPQTRFGDDVLSRIVHCGNGPKRLAELHETLVYAVNEMVAELIEQVEGVEQEQIYEITFSGNTTMQQILCRLDCSSLGVVPFVPAMGPGLLMRSAELGLHIHPRGRAFVLPVIGGFVGGDTVSGILATGLVDCRKPTLLVDIGTNGEIVLAVDGKLMAASTAAGPAFEGARILHGMRGTNGAIEKVVVDGRLRTNVIGDDAPIGLCGSALIDLAAELLRHGLVTSHGRMLPADKLPQGVHEDLVQRIVHHDGHPAFVLVDAQESGTRNPILLTQADIRELQLAAGAIRAGIQILLKRAGLQPSDLDAVLIAGGFGNFIRRSNAQRIGLLPCEIARQRIRYLGNTSLAGARLVAVSRRARRMADTLARQTEHVDLSTDTDFHAAFAEAMIFPDEPDVE